MNFGIMSVKGYARIEEVGNTQNLFSRCQTFLGIEKRPIFDQMFLIFQRKRMRRTRMTQKCVLKVNNIALLLLRYIMKKYY